MELSMYITTDAHANNTQSAKNVSTYNPFYQEHRSLCSKRNNVIPFVRK